MGWVKERTWLVDYKGYKHIPAKFLAPENLFIVAAKSKHKNSEEQKLFVKGFISSSIVVSK